MPQSELFTGRRKTSSARVRLKPGSGLFYINKRVVEDYFSRPSDRQVLKDPLELVGMADKIDVVATVKGGGTTGQAGAVQLGIARALAALNSEFRGPLKRAGYLRRDPRKVERKKYGRPKARKRFQHSKR